jgi:serine/threonine-protein kinase
MVPSVVPCGLAGDFGLARLLMGNNYIRNRSGSGTVAYQAPEVFVEGSKLTPAVDVYSFGIMMYELYCCRRPYTGHAKDTIAKR